MTQVRLWLAADACNDAYLGFLVDDRSADKNSTVALILERLYCLQQVHPIDIIVHIACPREAASLLRRSSSASQN
jgi:hypothetical protein